MCKTIRQYGITWCHWHQLYSATRFFEHFNSFFWFGQHLQVVLQVSTWQQALTMNPYSITDKLLWALQVFLWRVEQNYACAKIIITTPLLGTHVWQINLSGDYSIYDDHFAHQPLWHNSIYITHMRKYYLVCQHKLCFESRSLRSLYILEYLVQSWTSHNWLHTEQSFLEANS